MNKLTEVLQIAPGMIMPTAHQSMPGDPAGWLLCDGRAVSRTTYPQLFASIGTAFGAGDGSSTFNIPDLRGRTLVGAGQGPSLSVRSIGEQIGAEDHQLAATEMPQHNHAAGGLSTNSTGSHSHGAGNLTAANAGAHSHNIDAFTGIHEGFPNKPQLQGSDNFSANYATESSGAHTHSITGNTGSGGSHSHTVSGNTANAGSGDAHNNMQPSAVINWLIKT